jgi:hypothetical protein
MSLDILREKGVALERQVFTWRELEGPTYSKLDDDAFTRVRVILMTAIEAEAVRFCHAGSRVNGELRETFARVRRVEHHQQTLVNGLHPPDLSLLEAGIALEQTEVEVTAAVAACEPDPVLARTYRFGLIEDLDHVYRLAALYDRVEGRDANTILQSYTDVRPGRPSAVTHRDPGDDLRVAYRRATALPISKLHALTITALEQHARDRYVEMAPRYADPVGRRLLAEIGSIEEQHATQCACLSDPDETWIEQWLLHEANEVYNYWGCAQQESNPTIKGIWQRLLDYELGHLHVVMDLMERVLKRDPAELLPATLPPPIPFASQRSFVRKVLRDEVLLRAQGTGIIALREEADAPSARYRAELDAEGSPSSTVAEGYRYHPGTELAALRPLDLVGRRIQ